MGETVDLDRGTSASVRLPGFVLVNIAADHKLNDRMSLFGRIDNVFNKQYENPNGFEGTGIGFYAGVRFTD